MHQWKIVFFIAAGVYIFCATFFNIFASGERQAWDNPANDAVEETTTTTPIHTNGAANGLHHRNGTQTTNT